MLAIENEPVVVDGNGLMTDEDRPGSPNDVSPAGLVQVVTINPRDVASSTVVDVRFRPAALAQAGMIYPEDPQPEFVDVNGSTAAVSLQENNGIVKIDISDPANPSIIDMFSLGAVSDRPADLVEDDAISFSEIYPADIDGVKYDLPEDAAGNPVTPGLRFPDAIAFSPDGRRIFSADEGELNDTGGRSMSWWTADGQFIADDGGDLEAIATVFSHYPEGRSENEGIEMEGVTTARFGRHDFMFGLSERGSFMAIFDITRGVELVDIVPAGVEPEGVTAIPSRGLVVTSDEESGTLSIFEGISSRWVPSRSQPRLYGFSTGRPGDLDRPFAAISGLTSFEFSPNFLFGVPDNALPTDIYLIGVGSPFAKATPLISVKRDGEQARYDGEGIIRDFSIVRPFLNGFWIANEGNTSSNPNLLVQVDLFGNVRREIQLPNSIDDAADSSLPGTAQGPAGGMKIRSNGFEGVAMSRDGRYLYAAVQRDFANEFPTGPRYARIARYDLRQLRGGNAPCQGLRCGGDWDFFYYELDSNDPDNWAGLSEILRIGDNQFLVVERDKELGAGSQLKKLYAFSLDGLTPDTDGVPDASDTVRKVEAYDILDDFAPFEKVEGLALTRRGELWVGLDNDGGEVESRLINKGRLRNPLNRR